MHRRVMFLVAFLFTFPLLAQTRVVSRIEVRGNVPARIVTSQTALVEGRSYSDKDLDIAMGRLRRLPFVFDAQYTIEGETLVIDVNAMTRFFGELDANGSGYDGRETGNGRLAGAGRFFLGSGGVAHARLTEFVTEGDDGNAVEADYSHYGIAGTRLFATAGLSYSFRNDEGLEVDPTIRLGLGYPLTVRQTITASFGDAGFRRRATFLGTQRRTSFAEQRMLNLRWTYDTTNDPFFARHGTTISAGPTWSDSSSQFDSIIIGPADEPIEIIAFRNDVESRSLGAEARQLWATGTRGAFFGALRAAAIHSENVVSPRGGEIDYQGFEVDGNEASVTLGYAHNLFDFDSHPATRQRLEFGATYNRRDVDQPFRSNVTLDSTSLNAGYVLRREYATVRLNLTYLFD